MPPVPVDPVSDRERVARVVGTGLLDTPPEPAFDRLTHVACRALAAPACYASLITGDRQFLKSSGGLVDPCAPARELALTHGYCVEVVRTGRPLVIPDARGVERWRRHPVATELGLIAYVGVPLKSDGHVLGTLCVLDRVGRDWRPADVLLLEELAGALAHEVEQRLERLRLRRSIEQQRQLAALAQRAIERPRLQELLVDLVGSVAQALRADRCALVERGPGGDLMVTAGLGLLPGPISPSAPLRTALTRALSQPRRKPFSIDVTCGPLVLQERADGLASDPSVAGGLAPVGAGAPWGVLVVLARTPGAFTAADLELLSGFARLLGGAVRRARLDEELRAAERRSRSLLDSVGAGVCGLDRGGRLTFANAAAARLLGVREASELLGRPLESFMRGTAVGVASAPWVRAALAEGRPSHVEREAMQRADGLTFVAECRVVPLHREQQVEGAVVTFSNVTERARADEERAALLDAQRRAVDASERASAELTALLAAAPIGIGLVDTELRYRRLNHALAQLNGVPAEEHLGRRVRDMIGGPVGARLEALLRQVIATGEPIQGVEVAHAPDPAHPREVRVVLGSAYPVAIDGRVHSIGVACYEVTELKRHEEEQRLLSEVSSLLASFDFEPNLRRVGALLVPRLADRCAVHLTERDGSLRLAVEVPEAAATSGLAQSDPARGSLLGLAREAVRSRQVLVSSPIEGQEADPGATADPRVNVVDPGRALALAQVGVSAIMVIPLAQGDGPPPGVLTLSSAPKDCRNTVAGLRLAREIARRIGVAKERARLFQEAKEATLSREHVLAVVSHDLRTPLTTIIMSAARLHDVLERSPGTTPALVRPLVLIQRAARTMQRLIEDLLDFAAIEAGRLRIDARPEEVMRLVHEVLSSFQQVADAGHVLLFAEAAPALPWILADRERIEQVLSNIVGNALKVTPPGGAVSVRARAAGRFVRLSVTDTGPGIPRDLLRAIFERYWRGEGVGYRGLGLGLAIARGIVDAHGGTISAECERGGGATFHFTVPVAHRA